MCPPFPGIEQAHREGMELEGDQSLLPPNMPFFLDIDSFKLVIFKKKLKKSFLLSP